MGVLERIEDGEDVDTVEANAALLENPRVDVEEHDYRFLVYDAPDATVVYDTECDRFTPIAEGERVETLTYARKEAEGLLEDAVETMSTYRLADTTFRTYCATLRGTPGVITEERDRMKKRASYRVAGSDTRIEVEEDEARFQVEGDGAPDVSLPHTLVADLELEATTIRNGQGEEVRIRYGEGPGGERIRSMERVFRTDL